MRMTSALSGSLYLSLAQGVFALSGYAVNVGLARILGPEVYGQYGVTLSVLIWLEILLSFGLATATTKMAAESPESARAIARTAIQWTVACSVILFLLVLLFSGFVGQWLSDGRISILLKIASVDLLFYGAMKVMMAVQNGVRRYARTAWIIVLYAICKVVLILGFTVLGWGVEWALAGNFLASLVGLAVGLSLMGPLGRRPMEKAWLSPAFKISLPATLWAICIILLMSTDVWAAKAIIGGSEMGYYVAAGALAKLIYFLSTGIRMIVLPEISTQMVQGGYQRAGKFFTRMIVIFLPLMLGLLLVMAVFSEQIVILVYSETYLASAPLFRVLLMGYFAITFGEFFCHGLTAIGKAWSAGLLFGVLSLISLPVNVLLAEKTGIVGPAWGFGLLSVVGALFSCGLLFFAFHRFSGLKHR